MDDAILSILACPKCRGPLVKAPAEKDGLVCPACRALYPIIDGIPVLLVEEALPAPEDEHA